MVVHIYLSCTLVRQISCTLKNARIYIALPPFSAQAHMEWYHVLSLFVPKRGRMCPQGLVTPKPFSQASLQALHGQVKGGFNWSKQANALFNFKHHWKVHGGKALCVAAAMVTLKATSCKPANRRYCSKFCCDPCLGHIIICRVVSLLSHRTLLHNVQSGCHGSDLAKTNLRKIRSLREPLLVLHAFLAMWPFRVCICCFGNAQCAEGKASLHARACGLGDIPLDETLKDWVVCSVGSLFRTAPQQGDNVVLGHLPLLSGHHDYRYAASILVVKSLFCHTAWLSFSQLALRGAFVHD